MNAPAITPVDVIRHENAMQQARFGDAAPSCGHCKEPVQTPVYYLINGAALCADCYVDVREDALASGKEVTIQRKFRGRWL
jgi:formylmethanofuran dehydrogenase subunit E